jgi:hypothetical protein
MPEVESLRFIPLSEKNAFHDLCEHHKTQLRNWDFNHSVIQSQDSDDAVTRGPDDPIASPL